jgi:capsular polysaccharide transport system permease protein
MTTPLKVTKYRTRPQAAPARPVAPAPDNEGEMLLTPADDGFGNERFADAARPRPSGQKGRSPAEPAVSTDPDAIREEGLSGRQLRMARRVAQKNGIDVQDDFIAVAELRKRGIDPFQSSKILDLLVPAEDKPAGAGRTQLPQVTKPAVNLPANPVLDDTQRALEILRMQRDIQRRRRRNFLLLLTRLAAFVALPTLIAGWYYFRIATPLYATKSEFVIQQAEAQATGLGSMFRGTQFATSQDSITVQSYLQSRDAMLRLDQDLGFKAHFSNPAIDPIQRLEPDATNEAAYKLYKRNVSIGYDPTEGIIKMEVIAADPVLSQKFSEALIRYAEEQVDQLTFRLREDQMKGARNSFADAENKVSAAQNRVLELQEKLGVLDPLTETSSVMTQISTFEIELQKKRLELQQLLDNARPNQARVDGAKGDIDRLEALIAQLRAPLTKGSGDVASLAQVTGQLRIAEADLETRQMLLSAALQQLETARIEANRQVRYLSMGVNPVAPDEATYPRSFENTLLAFLIFAGIYLMLSLTASILREQVTS